MTKIFDWNANNGTLIDLVSGEQGTLTVGNGGFKQTEKGMSLYCDGSSTVLDFGLKTLGITFSILLNIKGLNQNQILGQNNSWLGLIRFSFSTNEIYVSSETNYNSYTFVNNYTYNNLILVSDNGDVKLYGDNIELTRTRNIIDFSDTFHTRYIGRNWSTAYFNGNINRVQFYNHVLTSIERSKLYQQFLKASQQYRPTENIKRSLKATDLSNENGLVAAYNMQPSVNGILSDISGNENNGTIYGAIGTKDGMNFDGMDDYILRTLDITGIKTISFKFNISSVTQGGIMTFGTSPDNLTITLASNNLYINVQDSATNAVMITNFPMDQDIDLVIIKDTGDITAIYVNGILDDLSSTATYYHPSGAQGIGKSQSGNYGEFIMYDFKVYNRALSETEAISYHNSFAFKTYLKEDFSSNGADGNIALPVNWTAGTGTFKVDELAIEQGEQTVNGGFDADVSWTLQTGWTISNGKAVATSAASGQQLFQYTILANRRYKVIYTISDYVEGKIQIELGTSSAAGTLCFTNGTFSENLTSAAGTIISFRVIGTTTLKLDNVSVIEIPPLPTFQNGTKYLENTVAGTIAIPSKQAYGTWEFDVYKKLDTTNVNTQFIAETVGWYNTTAGYLFQFSSTEAVNFYSTDGLTGTPLLCGTATSYISNNTWYRIKITRSLSGVFTFYIKGGAFGTNQWTLVDVSGGSGTNPITDNTYTVSNYFVPYYLAGDRVANFEFKPGIEQ